MSAPVPASPGGGGGSSSHCQRPGAPVASLAQLYDLYRADRLVVHTMPTHLIDKRPAQLRDDASALRCGSLLFAGGLDHAAGKTVPNAVARCVCQHAVRQQQACLQMHARMRADEEHMHRHAAT